MLLTVFLLFNLFFVCIFLLNSSKEFIQAKDVATHAVTSLKVGLRAAHLGFHKALCVLMGWDLAFSSNGRWVCKSLPDIKAWALKEDIIVWPPVVIIHNGSARDIYSNKQVKISIEQLENILRGELAFTPFFPFVFPISINPFFSCYLPFQL